MTNNNTHKTFKNTTSTKGNQHQGKKVLYIACSIFPHTYGAHALSPTLHLYQ